METDIIITLILVSLLFMFFVGLVFFRSKNIFVLQHKKHLRVVTVIIGGLILVGVLAFGVKITFLIISFAILLTLLVLDN